MSEAREAFDWRIVAYSLVGVALLFLFASLFGSGTGMYGSGFMMAWMWVWALLVVFALVLIGYFLGQRREA